MNFCTKCLSYYSQPGTCNCFAEAAGLRLAPAGATHACEPDPNSTAMACRHCGRALSFAPTVVVVTHDAPTVLVETHDAGDMSDLMRALTNVANAGDPFHRRAT